MGQTGRVFFLQRPAVPRSESVEEAICFEEAARIGAVPGFSTHKPRSLFDLERDAEVAEVVRAFEAYKADTEKYLAERKKFEFVRWIATSVSLGALICGVGYIALTQNRIGHTTPVATGTSPAIERKLPPKVEAVPMPVAPPQQEAGASAKASLDPKEASESQRADGVSVDNKRPATGPLPVSQSTAPAYEGNAGRGSNVQGATTQPGASKLVAADTNKVQPVKLAAPAPALKSVVEAPATEKPKVEEKNQDKMFSVDEKEPPAQAKQTAAPKPVVDPLPTKGQGKDGPEVASSASKTRPTDEPRKEVSSKSQPAPADARREKYGTSGVITLTPNGMIVFDRVAKIHKTLPVGSTLPDGSVLRSIDVKNSRISTDKGDVVFE